MNRTARRMNRQHAQGRPTTGRRSWLPCPVTALILMAFGAFGVATLCSWLSHILS